MQRSVRGRFKNGGTGKATLPRLRVRIAQRQAARSERPPGHSCAAIQALIATETAAGTKNPHCPAEKLSALNHSTTRLLPIASAATHRLASQRKRGVSPPSSNASNTPVHASKPHGNSHAALLEDVFGKACSMPVLKVAQALEMMAEGYLSVLAELRRWGLA